MSPYQAISMSRCICKAVFNFRQRKTKCGGYSKIKYILKNILLTFYLKSSYGKIRYYRFSQNPRVRWSLAFRLDIWKVILHSSINGFRITLKKFLIKWRKGSEKGLLSLTPNASLLLIHRNPRSALKDYMKSISSKSFPLH